MTTLDRRGLLLSLGAGLLGGCTVPLEDLAEGRKNPAEGGIGGTGIVGTLTEFGSLIVNGLRVTLNRDSVLSDALGRVSQEALAIGHSLTVEADRPLGDLVARRIHITHPLIGPIDGIAPDGASLRVLGVTVLASPALTARVRPGQRIAVSGLWRGVDVVASRLDPAGSGPSVMAGAVRRGGDYSLGGVSIRFADQQATPEPGSFVTLIGAKARDAFVVDDATPGRFTGAAGALSGLSVEGYLNPITAAPFWEVAGLGHSFDEAARLAPFSGQRTLFTGPYTGKFAVQNGLSLPEDAAARRDLLNQLRAGAVDGKPAR